MAENKSLEERKEGGRAGSVIELTMPEVPFLVDEAINTLRGNIQLSGYDLKVICVTSAFKHEGKSSLSFRIAKSMAALNRRTVFLDCDNRNSQTVARYCDHVNQVGLSEYLCGDVRLEDVICHTSQNDLDIIFTGAIAPNPSVLFSGDVFKSLIKTLRNTYDYVIVDTPPVNMVIDGVLIAKECDGTVLVVESGVTDRAQAKHAKQQLEFAGVKLLGVVLNKAGSRRSGYGYGRYGYGYGYGRYGYGRYGYGRYGYGEYGYGEKKEEK